MGANHKIWRFTLGFLTSCSGASGEHKSGGQAAADAADSTAQVQIQQVTQIGADPAAEAPAPVAAPVSGSAGAPAVTESPQIALAPQTGTPIGLSSSQAQLLQSCLAGWASNPFGARTSPDQLLTATGSILGIGGTVSDTATTAQPSLILVDSGLNLVGQTTFKLMNPNGWYCMPTGGSFLVATSVQIKAGAHLSAGGASIDVTSGSSLPHIGLGGTVTVQVVP